MEQAIPQRTRYTVEEYLRLAEASPTKLEYCGGEIIDMAGATLDHNRIAANLIGELRNRLKGRDCEAVGSDQRVLAADDRYAYPDVTVFCDEPVFDPRDPRMTITNPRVLIEVLSPSTEASDRGEKFIRYINLPELQEYFLVSQDRPQVQSFYRQPDGTWAVGPVVTSLSGPGRVPLARHRGPAAGDLRQRPVRAVGVRRAVPRRGTVAGYDRAPGRSWVGEVVLALLLVPDRDAPTPVRPPGASAPRPAAGSAAPSRRSGGGSADHRRRRRPRPVRPRWEWRSEAGQRVRVAPGG